MRDRPVARGAIIAAIVFLAAISAADLPIDFASHARRAGLTVALSLPASGDPTAITTQWLAPIESTIRGLGDVSEWHSRVFASGATIEVRFRGDVDAEVKAARLLAELAHLRSTLPADAHLSVFTSNRAGEQPKEVLAINDPARAAKAAEELRGATGVRDVRLFGASSRETRIQLRARELDIGDVRTTVAAALTSRVLGATAHGSREAAVRSLPSARDAAEVPVANGGRVVPLGALASVTHPLVNAETVARVNGRDAVLVLVYHDERVPLLAFSRGVQRVSARYGATVVASDAEELAVLLRRVLAALVIGSIALALFGWFIAGSRGIEAGAYFPVAVAGVITIARLSGGLDAASLVAALVAIAAMAPLAVSRVASRDGAWWPLGVAAAFGAAVPVAVACAPDPVPVLFAVPARMFAIATLCAIAAVSLIAPAGLRRVSLARRVTRSVVRASGSVVLFTIAASMLLFTYFGGQLDPRAAESGGAERVQIRVTPPAGTTLQQTHEFAQRVEETLEKLGESKRVWTIVTPDAAFITADLKPESQSAAAAELFLEKLRASVPLPASMVAIEKGERTTMTMTSSIEEQAKVADDRSAYRFLLRGNDAGVLRRTVESLTSQLGRLGVTRRGVRPEWPAPAAQFELIPRCGTIGVDRVRIAAKLSAATTLEPSWTLPDGTPARVVAFGAPAAENEIPQRADVYARTFDGATLPQRFESRMELVPGGATRESGRFVLPVTVEVPGYEEKRDETVGAIDRALSLFAVPAGVSIERPEVDKKTFAVASLRVPLLIAFVPLLLAALATIVLASLRAAIAATAAVIAAVATAGVVLAGLALAADVLTLFAIAAAVFPAAALSTIVLARSGSGDRAMYRTLRSHQLPIVGAAVIGGMVLASIAGTTGSLQAALRAPFATAAAVMFFATVSGVVAAPLALLLWRWLQRRRVAQVAANVDAFAETPRLVVRSVTKHYGLVRALHRVTFNLSPGITALLGPNGAGKTTLLRIITGLLAPTRGTVAFAGTHVSELNLHAYQRHLGFLPQEFNAYPALSAIDFLDHWALERGMTDVRTRRAEIERVIAIVGLEADAARRVRDFSGGMRQRIGIARALIGDPRLLIVDEPTSGLDLESRVKFREVIRELAADRIIILSTHIVSDVEAVASRLLVLAEGQLKWNGDMAGLIARAEGRVFDMIVDDDEARRIAQTYRLTRRVRVGDGIRVRGVTARNAALPGPAAEPMLEEAYLVAVGGDLQRPQRTFAFLFEDQRMRAAGW